jgi:hypothetical protein
MLKSFISLHAKLWWRSVTGAELFAILFYSLFLLLIFGQFAGIAVALALNINPDSIQELYPWFTADIQKLAHLLFLNMIWIVQFIFTKSNRLPLHENRKLLAFSMTKKKLAGYLNLMTFLHPVNLIFHFLWLLILIPKTETWLQSLAVIVLVLCNYKLILLLKWNFKSIPGHKLKWLNFSLIGLIFAFLFASPYLSLSALLPPKEQLVPLALEWMAYTPGNWFNEFAVIENNLWIILTLILFTTILFMLYRISNQLYSKALSTPAGFDVTAKGKKSRFPLFKKMYGSEPGKYVYTIWNHSYSKTQLLVTIVVVTFYTLSFSINENPLQSAVMVMLSMLPVMLWLIMLVNGFGFENREFLLSMQFPVRRRDIFLKRIYAAVLTAVPAILFILILIPYYYINLVSIIQAYLGLFLISMIVLNYVIGSSITNYKKIRDVNIMSLSNPVVPASVSFFAFLIILFVGGLSFTVIESIQVYHILILLLLNIYFIYLLRNNITHYDEKITTRLLPKIWNEL